LVKKSIFLLAGLTTFLFSCSDVNYSFEKITGNSDYKGQLVGFNLELLKSFPDGKPNEHAFGNWGKISRYDDMIRQFSVSIGWDWRLLASLICQESHFNPNVQSYAGAYGLMQIMPDTGKSLGIDITSSPENNLKAGILYINWLHSIFDSRIPDEKERINFILASYNAGPGHVIDAMKLAEKNGMNPQKWEGSVALWLLKKSEPQYYNDSVVKNGYYRGTESVNYVRQVLARFDHYKNIMPEEKAYPL
jgi:membrane-bound lytic murein transglycosylase F